MYDMKLCTSLPPSVVSKVPHAEGLLLLAMIIASGMWMPSCTESPYNWVAAAFQGSFESPAAGVQGYDINEGPIKSVLLKVEEEPAGMEHKDTSVENKCIPTAVVQLEETDEFQAFKMYSEKWMVPEGNKPHAANFSLPDVGTGRKLNGIPVDHIWKHIHDLINTIPLVKLIYYIADNASNKTGDAAEFFAALTNSMIFNDRLFNAGGGFATGATIEERLVSLDVIIPFLFPNQTATPP